MNGERSTLTAVAGGDFAAVEDSNRRRVLFGKYELGKVLGCGAFAKVYHARVVKTGQSVAIKAVSKQKVFKGGYTGHVKREIEIMHRLRHKHIVRLHEVLATTTKIYLVLEYAKGGELFTRIAKGRFSEELSRKYFQQLISAVGYCHSIGVYHRDLKPENLLLDENWDLKITDFGLSAVRDQIKPDGRLHTLCGTPAYVAPEILAKQGYDGARADIWSCGVILFVLNAGYLPFNDTNLMAMYRKIYRGEFRCPKWTSPELKRLISRLLDTNPETRITIEEIKSDPWFRKGGYVESKQLIDPESEFKIKLDGDEQNNYLNAFDLISFSSGFNLSSFFHNGGTERFLSAEPPEKIVDEIEAIAKSEAMKVTRKNAGIRVEGQNGNFTAVVEIYRLTDELVVVEIRNPHGREIWREEFRPKLKLLNHQPQE